MLGSMLTVDATTYKRGDYSRGNATSSARVGSTSLTLPSEVGSHGRTDASSLSCVWTSQQPVVGKPELPTPRRASCRLGGASCSLLLIAVHETVHELPPAAACHTKATASNAYSHLQFRVEEAPARRLRIRRLGGFEIFGRA